MVNKKDVSNEGKNMKVIISHGEVADGVNRVAVEVDRDFLEAFINLFEATLLEKSERVVVVFDKLAPRHPNNDKLDEDESAVFIDLIDTLFKHRLTIVEMAERRIEQMISLGEQED